MKYTFHLLLYNNRQKNKRDRVYVTFYKLLNFTKILKTIYFFASSTLNANFVLYF